MAGKTKVGQFLKSRNVTQTEASELLGISTSAFSAKANGTTAFKQGEIEKMRKAYRMTLEEVEDVFLSKDGGNGIELSEVEKLVIAQAFQKMVGELVATGRTDNLRGKVDAEMVGWYHGNPMAGRSYDVHLLGKKVGTYSLTVSEDTKSTVKTDFAIIDKDEFLAWAIAHGYVKVDEKAVAAHFAATGEVPDGCEPREVVVPGEVGGEVTKTTLRVEPELVMAVLGDKLAAATMNLLEGGK